MKVTLHSTTKLVELNGVPARVWEGVTAGGVPIHAFITRIAVDKDADSSELDAELQHHRSPCVDVAELPPRMRL